MDEEIESAFKELKRAMSTTPVLVLLEALLDFTQPFTVEIDACRRGSGAVLMQNRRPNAYFNRALRANNLGLSIYEKELLALVTAMSK